VLQQWQQRVQGLRGVAHQVHLHRVAQAEHVGLQVDLHATGLTFLGQEFGIREARADHQQGVALAHQPVAGFGAEQADGTGDPRQIIGQHSLAQQRLGHPCAEFFRSRNDLLGGLQRAGPNQYRHLAPSVEHVGGALQVLVEGDYFGLAVANAGMHRAMGSGRLVVGQVLQIVGQDDGGDPALTDRGAHSAVEQVADLFRRGCLLDEGTGHILEHRQQVELLLVVPAKRGARLLTDDGQHRLVVHARIVEAGEQVRGTRAGGSDAHAQFAGELGVGAGHERGHFFVAGLDELDLAVGPAQGTEHAIDAIAGVAKDAPHPPLIQALHQKVAYRASHRLLPECP